MKIDIFNTNKKYQIIYADPPWTFKTYSKKGKEKKSAECHYKCVNIKDIYKLPVANLTQDNCILFLWVTFPLLEQGLQTIREWGFIYKTVAFTWAKKNKKSDSFFMGCGYWTRANAEVCLLATKGNPKRISKSVKQLIVSPLQEHSKKPSETRERIVELMGDIPRIELFARQTAEKWDRWGNEAPENL